MSFQRLVGAPSIYQEPMILYDKVTEVNANDLANGGMATSAGEQAHMNIDRSTMNPIQIISSQVVDEDEPTFQIRGNNASQTTCRQSLKRKSGELDLLEPEVVRIFKSNSCLCRKRECISYE